jgi:ribonucleoside-triphosphate reductase
MTLKDITLSGNILSNILDEYNQNNSNMNHGAGSNDLSVLEYLYKLAVKQLLNEHNPKIMEHYNKSYFHLNDLPYLYSKACNCTNMDFRWVLRNGFVVGGEPTTNVTSGPPKRLASAINLAVEAMISASADQSGGIAYACFNYLLAPFWRGETHQSKKENIQSLIYRINQMTLGRQAQAIFSSIGLDLTCPEFLKDENVVKDGVLQHETYKEYEKEANEIIYYICKEMIKGDYRGSLFRFPNLVINITHGNLDIHPEIFDLVTKFYNVYFVKNGSNDEYRTVMGCRSALLANYTEDPNSDCLATGNNVYSCLNLPYIALKADGDIYKFYDILYEEMNILKDYSVFRNNRIYELINKGYMKFLSYKDSEGKPIRNFDNGSLVIGMLGLEEAVQILSGKKLSDNWELGDEILTWMEAEVLRWKKGDGLRWALFSNPSENTCYRLAKKVVKEYGFKASHANGTADTPYYTNGININVSDEVNIIDRIKIEGKLSKYVQGGNIVAINMGEAFSDPSSIKSLTEKIRDNSDAFFWAFSGCYSICNECNTKFNGIHQNCLLCKGETTIFDRVCGYMTPVRTWNPGKIEEHKNRYRY